MELNEYLSDLLEPHVSDMRGGERSMRFWQQRAAPGDSQPLPPEIYISLVDALFKDTRSLFVGSLAASITALITAWKTGEQALYLCSVAMVIVACMRALDVQAYVKRRPHLTTIEEAR